MNRFHYMEVFENNKAVQAAREAMRKANEIFEEAKRAAQEETVNSLLDEFEPILRRFFPADASVKITGDIEWMDDWEDPDGFSHVGPHMEGTVLTTYKGHTIRIQTFSLLIDAEDSDYDFSKPWNEIMLDIQGLGWLNYDFTRKRACSYRLGEKSDVTPQEALEWFLDNMN